MAVNRIGWDERLDLCDNEHEVIQVAREFVSMLEPWEIALLPTPCKPPKLRTAADVAGYAFGVVRWERDHSDRSQLVSKMAAFLARASIRLTQLASRGANDGEPEARQSA